MELVCVHDARYKMNLAMDELKEQWRVEKAALGLADAQRDIQDVSSNVIVGEASQCFVLRGIGAGERFMLVCLLLLA